MNDYICNLIVQSVLALAQRFIESLGVTYIVALLGGGFVLLSLFPRAFKAVTSRKGLVFALIVLVVCLFFRGTGGKDKLSSAGEAGRVTAGAANTAAHAKSVSESEAKLLKQKRLKAQAVMARLPQPTPVFTPPLMGPLGIALPWMPGPSTHFLPPVGLVRLPQTTAKPPAAVHHNAKVTVSAVPTHLSPVITETFASKASHHSVEAKQDKAVTTAGIASMHGVAAATTPAAKPSEAKAASGPDSLSPAIAEAFGGKSSHHSAEAKQDKAVTTAGIASMHGSPAATTPARKPLIEAPATATAQPTTPHRYGSPQRHANRGGAGHGVGTAFTPDATHGLSHQPVHPGHQPVHPGHSMAHRPTVHQRNLEAEAMINAHIYGEVFGPMHPGHFGVHPDMHSGFGGMHPGGQHHPSHPAHGHHMGGH